MPNRIIRETILTSDKVDELDPAAEVFYRRLLSKVDDYGRYDARPSILRAALFPLRLDRVREADISRWMAACQKAGLIALYSHDGKPYLECGNTDWQRRSPSRFPGPLKTSANKCAQVSANAHLVVDVDVVEVVKEASPLVAGEACPHDDIIAAYHELLPANPRIKAWTGTRQANLRTRWREDPKRQSLDYWRRFFAHVAGSPFLTGQRTGPDGRPFLPGLDWLVKPDNFAKVIESRYHDKGAA